MKRVLYTITLSLLLALPTLLIGQGWQHLYPSSMGIFGFGPGNSTLEEIYPTQDGGTIMVGTTSYPTGAPRDYIRLVKADQDGVEQWEKIYGSGQVLLDQGTSVEQTPDGGYIIGGSGGSAGSPDLMLMKVDANGDSLWSKIYPNAGFERKTYVRQNMDGGFAVFGTKDNNVLGIPVAIGDFHLMKTDAQGDTIWTKTYHTGFPDVAYDMIQLADSGFAMVGESGGAGYVIRTDAQGDTIWTKRGGTQGILWGVDEDPNGNGIVVSGGWDGFAGTSPVVIRYDNSGNASAFFSAPLGTARDVKVLPNGDIVTVGMLQTVFPNGTLRNQAYIEKADSNGTIYWHQLLNNNFTASEANSVLIDANGNIFVGGTETGIFFLAKLDSNGVSLSNEIAGNIFNDSIQNCVLDANEVGLANWMVTMTNGNTIHYALTDSSGNYAFQTDTGTFDIAVYAPNTYWQPCANQSTTFTTFYDSTTIDIGVQPLINCPAMKVDISTPFLRRCFSNTYAVSYCNNGTVTAQNAYIDIEFDSFLIVNSSTIPWTTQVGNIYTFPVGNVNVGDCGQFSVNVTVDCNAVLGQTHCVTAHAYPDSICNPIPNWTGVNIEVSGTCLGDSIEFEIKNTGSVDMMQSKTYSIIEDHVIMMQGTFQLNANSSSYLTIPTDGSTYRLITQQAPNHPFSTQPTVAIEGCTNLPTFLTGFVTAFASDDGAPFIATDCQENVGAFDPNDKRGFPQGTDNEHYILKNTDLSYHIRFQNTGTDTAFTVVIRDTLDVAVLDLPKIEFGTSSHPYEVEVLGEGILKFTFNNIMLPDSNINEAASHGFVKFRIPQKLDLASGTRIENSAAIYFDFNKPVITNVAYHTIATTLVFTEEPKGVEGVGVRVFPNPLIDKATFMVEDQQPRDLTFMVFDALGRMVHQEQFYNTIEFDFYNQNLTKGIYFYTIASEGQLINQGKIMVNK